jgi:protease-4
MNQTSKGTGEPAARREPEWGEREHAAAPQARPESQNWERSVLEKLLLAGLKEQRASRRWKIFFRLSWLLLGLALLGYVFWGGGDLDGSGGERAHRHTAMVQIDGEISADGANTAAKVNRALLKAFQQTQAQAVVLWINSPGGSPVQAGLIHDEIRRLKALYHKPVYAVVEDVCASAAYYIAVAADDIYVDKASLVGSIGVLMNGFGVTELMHKLGVERRLLTAGENKAMLDPFSPQSEIHKQYLQSMLDQIHQQFIKVVRDGRGQRLRENEQTFTGLVWTGEQAIHLGLADHLGGVAKVAREVVKAEDVVDYTEREGVSDRLVRRLGAAISGSGWQSLINGYALR